MAAYNAQTDWLTGIGYKNGAAGPLLLDIAYPEHDKIGNRKARVEDNVATTYGYDVTYQLRQAKTGAAEENFAYDAVGNRESGPTVKETPAASYSHDAGNRMLKGRQFDYSYDEFGNQQFRYLDAARTKFWQYSWDGENRLIEARLVKAGATLRTVSFTYDPFGRRMEKKVVAGAATTTTGYLYDGADIVLESVAAGSATVTTQYVHGPGIDEPLALVRNGQSYFYHADGLGSIVAITDSTPTVVQHYAYDAFGMVTPSQPEFENSYTYTGREWDQETGLYFYRARYYDPMEGRFISKDPIGFAGGDVNLYRYVQNNSVNFIDPWGLLKVHLWRYTGSGPNDRWGHASMTLANGTHISWWPQSQNRQASSFSNNIYSVDAYPNQTMADDISYEQQPPDLTIDINGLDEAAIESWWKNFKKHNQWETLSQNCSTTVADGLKAGGASVDITDAFDAFNTVWTPADVERFVRAIK